MKIHEYQAKEILRGYDVPVPRGIVATSPDEAVSAAKELGGNIQVVKAQIHAGGRGKAGGVKVAKSFDQVHDYARDILGKRLITHQTGPEGKEVLKVLIEEGLPIKRELYIGVVIDRAHGCPVVMACAEGGVEIEEIAAKTPEKILKAYVNTAVGFQPFQARQLAYGMGLESKEASTCASFLLKLYKAFEGTDSSLFEINPLIITEDGQVIALDAKVNFDDNALFRHKSFHELRDLTEEDPLEIEASKFNLNYIKLDGEVGCMVNGAGLAMGTMDLVKLAGSMPANFLDVGGAANVERVAAAFKILMSDTDVKAVLVNIFGGIVRCDRVANGIIEAMKQVEVTVPVVTRLQGTNAKEARELLSKADFPFIVAEGLAEAAEKVVQAMRSKN